MKNNLIKRLIKKYGLKFMVFFVLFFHGYGTAIAEILRDPTRPPGLRTVTQDTRQGDETGITGAGPKLQAIMISENHRSAIINNRRVNIGGEIEGARIISIDEGAVVLKSDGKLRTLKLYPQSSKKTAVKIQNATR